MTTTRLRAFARALDRLSSHDMAKVLAAMWPNSAPMYDSDRYQTMLRLNTFAMKYSERDQQPKAPDHA